MRVFLGGGPYFHWPQNFKDDLCVANDDNLYLSYISKTKISECKGQVTQVKKTGVVWRCHVFRTVDKCSSVKQEETSRRDWQSTGKH